MATASSSSGRRFWAFSQPSTTAVFCPRCQSMLNMPDERELLRCPDCPFTCNMNDPEASSEPVAAQEQKTVMRDAGEAAKDEQAADYKRATVDDPCPKCQFERLQYYTLQLRSVDEGQTVFFECEKCGHTFSTNT